MNTLSFLERALLIAEQHSADGKNGPFGAVIVKNEKIIAEGWNRVVENHDPTEHAEIVAIRDACKALHTHNLSGCTIYCSCEPCPMCLSAIYWARIDRVVYAASQEDAAYAGFDDSFLYYEIEKSWPQREIKSEQHLVEQGRLVLQKWRDNPHKINY
jgi:tRNA(Arg) A34 adenosine deaminase TadA